MSRDLVGKSSLGDNEVSRNQFRSGAERCWVGHYKSVVCAQLLDTSDQGRERGGGVQDTWRWLAGNAFQYVNHERFSPFSPLH